MPFKLERRYTLPNRLSDVIRLISVLSIDNNAFRSEKGLKNSLRSEPLSHAKKEWKEIIKEHPEFFRSNGSGDSFALVIRSYFPENVDPLNDTIKLRSPLTVTETQKLIDVAIGLHDKEYEKIQSRLNRWLPLGVAVIALIGSLVSTYFNSHANSDINKKIDSLNEVIKRVELNTKKSTVEIQPKILQQK
jgi:hypothetical protein